MSSLTLLQEELIPNNFQKERKTELRNKQKKKCETEVKSQNAVVEYREKKVKEIRKSFFKVHV